MTAFKTLLISTLLLLSGNALAQSEQGPIEIVRETTNELFRLVDKNREKYENDVQALRDDIRPILLAKVDTLYLGRLILPRSARGMEQEKVEEFSDALSNLLIRRYADGLLDFRTRDQVEIRPLAGNNTERMTKVRTRVTLDNNEQAPVEYVFRKTDEGWKIYDVKFEGASYVVTLRNQIGKQVSQEGFDATLEELQQGDIEIQIDD